MHLRKDLSIRHVCRLHLIYIPNFAPSGRPVMGTIIDLNDTGVFLWDKLQPRESFTLSEMASLLQQEYEIDSDLAVEDCKATLTEWAEYGLVLRN